MAIWYFKFMTPESTRKVLVDGKWVWPARQYYAWSEWGVDHGCANKQDSCRPSVLLFFFLSFMSIAFGVMKQHGIICESTPTAMSSSGKRSAAEKAANSRRKRAAQKLA